jgi:hypothetical protein
VINNASQDKTTILNVENAKSFFKFRGSTTDINAKGKLTSSPEKTTSKKLILIRFYGKKSKFGT